MRQALAQGLLALQAPRLRASDFKFSLARPRARLGKTENFTNMTNSCRFHNYEPKVEEELLCSGPWPLKLSCHTIQVHKF